MPVRPRSLPLLLVLLLAVVVAVLTPAASPVAGLVVAGGLLLRLVVARHRHRPAALPTAAVP